MRNKNLSIIKTLVTLVTMIYASYKFYQYLQQKGIIRDLRAKYSQLRQMLPTADEAERQVQRLTDQVMQEVQEFADAETESRSPVVRQRQASKITKEPIKKNSSSASKSRRTRSAASAKSKKVKSASKATKKKQNRLDVITDYLRQNRYATMSDIRVKFPAVTARTLRRDLNKLEKSGVVEQEGKTRGSVYKFIG